MLKVRIIGIGKDKTSWVTDGCAHYTKLLSRWAVVDWKFLPSPKFTASARPAQIKTKEAQLLGRAKGAGACIALADSGEQLDSIAFASLLEQLPLRGHSTIQFLIGGPHGLADITLEQADKILSLSPLTYSHQLVRVVLAEQLYRALSIIHGTDYHK